MRNKTNKIYKKNKKGGHIVRKTKKEVEEWERLATCTTVDCAFNTLAFLYGDPDESLLNQAYLKYKAYKRQPQAGVTMNTLIEYLDWKFQEPHMTVKICEITQLNPYIKQVSVSENLLNLLLNIDDALPIQFVGQVTGHIAVLGKSPDGVFYLVDPQTQEYYRGFQEIGELMVKYNWSSCYIIFQKSLFTVPSQFEKKYNISSMIPTTALVEDRPRKGFTKGTATQFRLPVAPPTKLGQPGIPGQRFLPKPFLGAVTFTSNMWVPASAEFPLAIIKDCNVGDKWERWVEFCPPEGGIHGQHYIGCAFNVLGFLNSMSIEMTRREVEEAHQRYMDAVSKNQAPVGTYMSEIITWFNSASQLREIKYEYKETTSSFTQPIIRETTKEIYINKIKGFFNLMNEKMPVNSCTLIQLKRPPPATGHYVVISKREDGKLITVDPQIGKIFESKYDALGKIVISDKFAETYFKQKYYQVSVIYAVPKIPIEPIEPIDSEKVMDEEDMSSKTQYGSSLSKKNKFKRYQITSDGDKKKTKQKTKKNINKKVRKTRKNSSRF